MSYVSDDKIGNIPKEVIDYAVQIVHRGDYCALTWDEKDLEKLRQEILEGIERYKRLKKQIAEAKTLQSRIAEWLKSIGHETA